MNNFFQKIKFLFFALILCLGWGVNEVWALEGGARPISMGGAFVALADDVYSSTWNPAGLGWLADQEAALSLTVTSREDYISGDFVADDYFAYSRQIGQSEDIQNGTVGIYYMNSSFEDNSSRSKTSIWAPGIAYGRRFFDNDNISWGASISYFNFESRISTGITSTDTAFSLNAGFLWYITDDISLGLLVENLNEPTYVIHGFKNRLVRIWQPGIAYYIDDSTVMTLDIYDLTGNTKNKGSDYSQNVRLGFEHYFADDFSFRIGVHQPNSEIDSSKYYSLGIGWQYSEFMITHPVTYYFDYTFIYWEDSIAGNDDYLHQLGISAKF